MLARSSPRLRCRARARRSEAISRSGTRSGLINTELVGLLMASGRPLRSKIVPRGAGLSTGSSWRTCVLPVLDDLQADEFVGDGCAPEEDDCGEPGESAIDHAALRSCAPFRGYLAIATAPSGLPSR